jgi:A/G-specific adenine glycosylase
VTLDDAAVARIQTALLTWYDRQARAFAFRGIRDPYAILVSEFILQQTQASRGEHAWRAFMERFPTVDVLAAAAPADVLRQWSGLGYNRRALNLQRAARAIVERHGGHVPDELAALEALPGIGPYTARAVLAIAFGRPVGPVDTNVRRVLGRVVAGHGSAHDPGEAMAPRDLQATADAIVPVDRPADWTAALMDIGATLCGPLRPDCAACPLAGECRFATLRAEASPTLPGAQAVESGALLEAIGAGGSSARRRTAEAGPRYEATNRWLRGRIMARLSGADEDAWLPIAAPIGPHGPAAVATALDQLRSEGLAETDGSGRWRLPVS